MIELQKSLNPVQLIDTTLRDGAQTPGIIFSIDQKLRIVHLLSEAGISWFEAVIPASGEHEINSLKALKSTFPNLTFIAWCRAAINDIRTAEQISCDAVHISFPVSPVHIQIPGFSEDYILELLSQCITYARPRFKEISIGAQDASRADYRFLSKFIEKAAQYDIERIRIADTVGILSPSSTTKLVAHCKKAADNIEIEFHAHNDLGMATANTISAFEAGASSADVTISGIGERAGNAALEEVVMAISIATQFSLPFKTEKLVPISSEFAQIIAQPVHPMKPITGKNIFCHESGIHTHGLLKDRCAYEPYDASITGHEPTRFVGGLHSGAAGIKFILESQAIDVTRGDLNEFLRYLKQQSLSLKKTYSDCEVLALFKKFRNTNNSSPEE